MRSEEPGAGVARQRRQVLGYAAEAAWEVAVVIASMGLAVRELDASVFFVNFLGLPVAVGVLRFWVSVLLVRMYIRIERSSAATALTLIGQVQSASCLLSARSLPVFSAMLAMWHGFWFLLMICYTGSGQEASVAGLLSAVSFVCMAVNCCLWYAFKKLVKDPPERPVAREWVPQPPCVDRAVRRVLIRLAPYRVLEAESGCMPSQKSCRVVPTRSLLPESCVICLEEFTREENLAQLACGHIFHPVCVDKWVRQGWRCPFRCAADDIDASPDERNSAPRTPDNATAWEWTC